MTETIFESEWANEPEVIRLKLCIPEYQLHFFAYYFKNVYHLFQGEKHYLFSVELYYQDVIIDTTMFTLPAKETMETPSSFQTLRDPFVQKCMAWVTEVYPRLLQTNGDVNE